MTVIVCHKCDQQIDVDVEERFFSLEDEMNEIGDLLAGGHAEEAYRRLAQHYDLGPLEARKIRVASYGTPPHLL